ncbi:transporter [Pelomonas sp. V22]|uniref:transporter n=1 Tax=Pelomonas sp. V22 TaxID=2822139 RepID=UPI0024A841B4|nr:transporter [Pelomonas sp. V22]MDI4631669.1 transporter [Pelomonas sp. V22]
MTRTLLGLACLALPTLLAAEPIATDRPDFVESAATVGKGRFQIETSLAWERDRDGALRSWTRSTPSLLRIGLADDWELRFETDGAMRSRSTALGVRQRERGWSDLSVGLKWHASDGDEATATPDTAWLFHVDGDTGSRAYRGQGLRPSVRFVAEWELPAGWSAGLMPGLYMDRNEDGKRFVGGILAAVLGKSITDRLRGFVELSAQQIASSRNGGKLLTFDTGLAYLLADNMQVDMAVSRGLNKTSPDLSWTVGFSAKF